MTTIQFQKVLDRVCELISVPQASIGATDLASIFGFINEETENLWKFYWWPELMKSELRYYRDAYNGATAYVVGNEIWDPTTLKYYICILASTGNLPTNTTFWSVATTLNAYIEMAQTGQTVIGTVRIVSPDNPVQVKRPRRMTFVRGEHGIHLPGNIVPSSVYVWFRIKPSDYSGVAYDPAVAYGAGLVRYYASAAGTAGFLGDYWTVVTSTTAGQNPETNPTKWLRMDYPDLFREVVARAAHYRYLVKDGASDSQIGLARADKTDSAIALMHEFVGQQSQAGILNQ